MPAVLEHPASLLESAPETPAAFPAWFAERQRAAWQRFLETPTPKRGDEAWRFSSYKQLDFSGIARASAEAPADVVTRSQGVEAPAAKFVFANEQLLHSGSQLPEGVVCLPLADALVSHGDLVREHFMKQDTRLGSAKWTALHEANLRNGLFVHVPAGVEVEGTIEVFHWISGDGVAIFPHTLIVTGANAKVRVADYFQSANDDGKGLCIAVNDLIAGEGSKLDYVAIQAFNEKSKVIQVNETGVAKDASAIGFILNTGAAWARNESLSRLEGEGSRSDMLSVSIPAREQEYDQRTFQHHVSPGAYSDLLYKNSLYDESRTIFSGLIFVDEGAHRTDAYQTCRNLFMSDEAEANSMPGLEINADDVKCSHGSTSAQIDESEIFYLRARGIDPVRARQLIARGFSVEVIERLADEKVEEVVLRFLDDKFAHIAGGGA
ncbi:Fe-S cluster assembly protein SufD [Luteolibacter flavescens]|uniref:Fe-S cluster assembly protein SufD n=1 Tax=Luteolibacter flavescens TaxID=1859460 RepID=A0ABT3FV39_9BACT|nr:Fe-S cluster assembly protein SufD [Luteolibacter flavescens]MCW1887454.1 Fe-S cluster assembly protein SufD [Luteolibacter flavescens]